MGKIREFIDRFLLSDHEWKEKYCPTLYQYLFSDKREKMYREMIENHKKNRKICPDCRGIYFEDTCPECNHGRPCLGYEVVS